MDSHTKAVIAICCMVFIFLLAAIAGGTYTSVHRSDLIGAIADKGTNPQAASCAIDGPTESNRVICTLLANKGDIK